MSTQSSILDGGPSMQHLRTVRSFLHHGDVTGVGLRYGVDVHRLLEGVRTLEREAAADSRSGCVWRSETSSTSTVMR